MSSRPVHLDLIRLDGDTQPRAEIDEAVVAEYAEAMEAGDEFPPIVVFHDGADYWLADGFHRYHAMRRAGLTATKLDMKPGTRRDAVLYSVGANQHHGLRRKPVDKRKSVETLLNDEEWVNWPQERIAAACGVSREYVSRVKREMEADGRLTCDRSQVTVTTRHGTVATMDTSNIGRRAETPRQEPETEASAPVAVPRPLPERIPSPEISDAMAFAEAAISQLERISITDPHRVAALFRVNDWITNELNREEKTA